MSATHAVPTGTHEMNLWRYLRESWLNWLLLFIPVAIGLEVSKKTTHADAASLDLWIFIISALTIIPLAGLIGHATEELSARVGPGIGGFLNATFGNATELIIALFALAAGLPEVVKASISGSIIGNILLVMGASMWAGGWRRDHQCFNRTHAGASSAMLFLAVVALVMPAVFDFAVYRRLDVGTAPLTVNSLSLLVAGVLFLVYLASLVFSLKTHRALFTAEEPQEHAPRLSKRNAIILLLLATIGTAIMAEFLVGAIETATRALHMTEFFVGVIVVAIVGNAAEHASAIMMARKNQMDLAVTICTGSSTQIALFVAPVLVFASFLLGHPMSLIFNIYEIIGIGLSVFALALVTLDGESNWFEGVQLVAVYLILAIVFFFVPAGM